MIIIIMMILIKRPSQSTEKHISDPIELGSMLHAGGYLSPKVSGKWLFSMSLQVYNWFICFCSDNLQKIFAKWGYHSELQSSGENPTQSWSLKLNSILVMGLYIWLVVWNMNFIFPYIGINHPNWLSYFSEGFKPPTRYGFIIPYTRGDKVTGDIGPLDDFVKWDVGIGWMIMIPIQKWDQCYRLVN